MSEISRRSFLNATALGMAAAPVAMSAARAQDKPVPPSEKVRVGLIGCGGISEADMQCFLLSPEVDVPIICDIDDSHIANRVKLIEAKRGKTPDTVKDFRRVIDRKDVDVVLVCTPDHWHALPTIYACEAGKDVYCEKPLGKTIDEGRAMLEAAKKYNRVVQMGTHWRSGEHYRDAIEFVRSGKLGKIRMVRAWAYLDWLGGIGNPPDCAVPDGAPGCTAYKPAVDGTYGSRLWNAQCGSASFSYPDEQLTPDFPVPLNYTVAPACNVGERCRLAAARLCNRAGSTFDARSGPCLAT